MTMNWTRQFAHRSKDLKRTAVRELLKLTNQPGMISFAGGLPGPDLFPIERAKQAALNVIGKMGKQALQYGETEGVSELRDWIAVKFSRPHFQLKRSNVVITSGGQQALDLVGRVLLNEGDKVIVENPTYLALLAAWRLLGVQFCPVPSDENGMRMDAMESIWPQKPKLVYAVPTFQNPQGTTLALERRIQLVERLRQNEVGMVEDDPYGELRYSGNAVPSIFELDARRGDSGQLDSRVIYIGTFSKVLVPGLRVGWAVASEDVIEMVVRAKQAADLQTSTLSQYIVCDMIRDGFLEQHVPTLCAAYRERRDTMLVALEKYFPREATWTRPEGGMFLMVTLPGNVNACDVLHRALQQKVAFVPGEEFHVNGAGRSALRLNFSNSTPALIEEGIKRLGEVLKGMGT
jgi:2-aminoadipate transaminase